MSRVRYVAGLLFSADGTRVALVRKNRPTSQDGKLNAIGGHVEAGEDPLEAMEREFQEETGVRVPSAFWDPVAVVQGDNFECHFFANFSDVVDQCRTMEDEEITVLPVALVRTYRAVVSNLQVIIALALDPSGLVKPVILTESPKQHD